MRGSNSVKYPNLLFAKDGEIYDLDGVKCMAIGGAYSVDKYIRLASGLKWFEDEQPSEEIKAYVERQLEEHHVDVIFAHTCPYRYRPTDRFLRGIDQKTVDTGTEEWLDIIFERYPCKAWYCGHWHIDRNVENIHFLFENVVVLQQPCI